MAGVARMSDVAKLAGVSTMTVSRALSGSVKVSDEIRKRVLAAVKQLDYQPNELARSLRDRHSHQIGILVPYLFDPFFATCAHAISTVAQQHSYSVILSTSNENPKLELKEASSMVRRNIEGLVVIPAAVPDDVPSLFLSRVFAALPIVALDRPITGHRHDCLLVENREGARRGVEHLIALGHRDIAFFGLSTDLYTMRMRELGFRDAIQAAGLKLSVIHVGTELEATRRSVRQLLSKRRPPTALFCANNLLTRHVLHGMHAFGVHPPNPIALVGFDDFETADLLNPGITTVRQPVEDLGRIAAETLFELLNQKPDAPRQSIRETILPVQLIVRGSCGGKAVVRLGQD